MSRQYINGYSYPKFTIKDLSGNVVDTINLAFTDEAGLIEDIKPIYIQHQLLSYNIVQKRIGFHIVFTLSYESASVKTNTLKIKKILDYIFTNNYIIELTPRSDFDVNTFEVILINESIQQGILQGGALSKGNRLINLQFQTKNVMRNSIPWFDGDDRNVTIEDFATTN